MLNAYQMIIGEGDQGDVLDVDQVAFGICDVQGFDQVGQQDLALAFDGVVSAFIMEVYPLRYRTHRRISYCAEIHNSYPERLVCQPSTPLKFGVYMLEV